MANIDYAIDDAGEITFPASGHGYRVRRQARGRPAVTLTHDGSVLATDRLDLDSAKERARFAAVRNGQAELVERELLVIAQLLADDGARPEHPPAQLPAIPYRATPTGLVFLRSTQAEIPLCNFTAQIIAQVAEDDGVEVRRLFEIEANCNRVARFAVPASQFTGMNWPVEHLGASATIYAGSGMRDHARAGIQLSRARLPNGPSTPISVGSTPPMVGCTSTPAGRLAPLDPSSMSRYALMTPSTALSCRPRPTAMNSCGHPCQSRHCRVFPWGRDRA